ncbi:MAG: hypothetical protein U0802_22455 [Candidatus Binatia bacterium]
MTFCAAAIGVLTMCTRASRRTPDMPTGSLMPSLIVDDELLRQHVQDVLIHRQRHRARRVEHAFDVARRHLAALDGHHAMAVEALDLAAADAGEDGVNLAPGTQLGFLTALAIACTVASMLTTTPRRKPSLAAVPQPMTLSPPPAGSSATTAATLAVPTSRPTSSSGFLAIPFTSAGRRRGSRRRRTAPAVCRRRRHDGGR